MQVSCSRNNVPKQLLITELFSDKNQTWATKQELQQLKSSIFKKFNLQQTNKIGILIFKKLDPFLNDFVTQLIC